MEVVKKHKKHKKHKSERKSKYDGIKITFNNYLLTDITSSFQIVLLASSSS